MSDSDDSKIKYKKKKSKMYCSNCNKFGHQYKYCKDAVTSYGVIFTKIDDCDTELIKNSLNETDSKVNAQGISIPCYDDIKTFCKYKNNIKFLLIRRKHSLGFMEFIRGRYEVSDVDKIIALFRQMTNDEISKIKIETFDTLWNNLWNNSKSSYRNEYLDAKSKFEHLVKGDDYNLNLQYYVDNVVPVWGWAEWGFPKGRRNYQENNYDCGFREFMEETDFKEDEFISLDKIQPVEELLIGTDGVNYKHIYYFALCDTDKEPVINEHNRHQTDEIGDIGWFTYNEALKIIRPYHIERKKLLTEYYMFILNILIRQKI